MIRSIVVLVAFTFVSHAYGQQPDTNQSIKDPREEILLSDANVQPPPPPPPPPVAPPPPPPAPPAPPAILNGNGYVISISKSKNGDMVHIKKGNFKKAVRFETWIKDRKVYEKKYGQLPPPPPPIPVHPGSEI